MEPTEETASNPQITESAGRDVKGRFAKGNLIGKGRPVLGRSVAQLIREIGNEEISIKEARIKLTRLEATLRRAWVDAMAGNKDAREFIFERGWGKPVLPVVLDEGQGNVLLKWFESMENEVLDMLIKEAERIANVPIEKLTEELQDGNGNPQSGRVDKE